MAKPAPTATALLLIASGLFVASATIYNLVAGGDPWKQGDWLINNMSGYVRRGIFGSGLIRVADSLHLSPVVASGLLVLLLLAALYAAIWRMRHYAPDPQVFLLIVASGGFLVLFWAANPTATPRKEILAFTALALAAIGVVERRRLPLLAGSALFVLGAIGHELTILLLPALGLIFAQRRDDPQLRRFLVLTFAVIAALNLAVLAYTLLNSRVADPAQVCLPLLQRAVAPVVCSGAIDALSGSLAQEATRVMSQNIASGLYLWFFLATAFALAPWAYLLRLTAMRQLLALSGAAPALPILPLYVSALDWSRWLSLFLASLFFTYLTATGTGRLPLRARPNGFVVAGFVGLGLLMPPAHMLGLLGGGFPLIVLETGQKLLVRTLN